jgi:hypothetical protein
VFVNSIDSPLLCMVFMDQNEEAEHHRREAGGAAMIFDDEFRYGCMIYGAMVIALAFGWCI